MKIILIGRGSSCLKCSKEFIDSHDLVCVMNKFIYKGYENYVGNKAHVQFRNRTTENFTKQEVDELGLIQIVFTNQRGGYPSLPHYYDNVKQIKPNPPLKTIISKEHQFDQSSGIVGLYYILKNYDALELSMVGFDFYEKGFPPYYFKPKDVDSNLKYLWNNVYSGNVVKTNGRHDADQSSDFVKSMIDKYKNVNFNIITNSKRLNGFKRENLKIS